MDLFRIIETDLLEWILKLSFLTYLKLSKDLLGFGVDFDHFWSFFFFGFLRLYWLMFKQILSL